MDATVSARIPRELRDQADGVLSGLGSSHTKLINAAYRYLLDVGDLPDPGRKPASPGSLPSEADLVALQGFLDATTLELPSDLAALTAADIRAARIKERHGTLA